MFNTREDEAWWVGIGALHVVSQQGAPCGEYPGLLLGIMIMERWTCINVVLGGHVGADVSDGKDVMSCRLSSLG